MIVLVLVLLALFYLADKYAAWTPKARAAKEAKEKPKEPKKEEEKCEIIAEVKTLIDPPQLPNPVPYAESPRTIEQQEQEEDQKRAATRGRIREYYEQKWQRRGGNSYDANFDGYSDNEDARLTPDDVRKLVALKDLFDRK